MGEETEAAEAAEAKAQNGGVEDKQDVETSSLLSGGKGITCMYMYMYTHGQ